MWCMCEEAAIRDQGESLGIRQLSLIYISSMASPKGVQF